MTSFEQIGGRSWHDEHRTLRRRALESYSLKASSTGDPRADIPERNQVIAAQLGQLAQQRKRVSIVGSAWSQSDLFASPAITLETPDDSAIWAVSDADLRPEHLGKSRYFVIATGGTKISSLMEWLDQEGLSMRSAGTHKGQSIAGAIATGTHGSFVHESGIEAHVRGLGLVAGPDHIHWLEHPGHRVLADEFAELLGDRNQDARFGDALIHLGGLGYLSTVLLEVVDRFGLSWAKALEPLPDKWWDQVQNGDFVSAAEKLANGNEPAFYELTFDPNQGPDHEVIQTVYWKDNSSSGAISAALQMEPAVGACDLLDHLMNALNLVDLDFDTKAIISAEDEAARRFRLIDVPAMTFDGFRKSLEQGANSKHPESLKQLTLEWTPRRFGPLRVDTFNAAICVNRQDLRRTMEAGFAIAAEFRKHYVYTVRFAKKSPASMGFLRFDDNAVINVDGLTKNLFGGMVFGVLEELLSDSDNATEAFCNELEDRRIPFSMHWGKDIPSSATKIASDFGDNVGRWRGSREALVPKNLRQCLTSPMLRQWGLD